jgi:hypothetical protein
MKKADKAKMYQDIQKHGEKLLKIFPNAKQKDPVKLCKSLRTYERKISAITLALCNGDPHLIDGDSQLDNLHNKVGALLKPSHARPFFINRDPRGYALKIQDTDSRIHSADLHRDMGGYGILAPDFTPMEG